MSESRISALNQNIRDRIPPVDGHAVWGRDPWRVKRARRSEQQGASGLGEGGIWVSEPAQERQRGQTPAVRENREPNKSGLEIAVRVPSQPLNTRTQEVLNSRDKTDQQSTLPRPWRLIEKRSGLKNLPPETEISSRNEVLQVKGRVYVARGRFSKQHKGLDRTPDRGREQ